MSGMSRLILFSDGALYLAPNARFEIAQTNLAEYLAKVKTDGRWYFEVEGSYDRDLAELDLRISNHSPEDISGFALQKLQAPVLKINVKNIKWSVLENMLYAYSALLRSADFLEFEPPKSAATAFDIEQDFSTKHGASTVSVNTVGEHVTPYVPNFIIVSKAEPAQPSSPAVSGTFHETVEYPYAQVVFYDGYVTVAPRFAWHNEAVTLSIVNEKIMAAFGYIRGYFANVLGIGKTISVTAAIEMHDGEVISSNSTCAEISAIADDLLELVKQRRTEDIISDFVQRERRQTIVTAEELLDGAPGGNIFAQSAADVVRVILLRDDIRNKRQLHYLAAEKHHTREKVRFTLVPNVGFVFFIENGLRFHFCWELLNSNATYVWTFDRREHSVASALARVEASLSAICTIGRRQYKAGYAAKQLDADLFFRAVHHANEKLGEEASFERWKDKIVYAIG